MRRLLIASGFLTLAGVLAACQASHVGLSMLPTRPTETTAVIAPATTPEGPTGAVSLTVKWPDRQVQYIPGTATKIRFGVYAGGSSTPLATGSVTRTNEATSSYTFKPLAVGPYTFLAEALDPDGYVGASGSTDVTVVRNVTTQGAIHMVTTTNPTITGFSPKFGVPNEQVFIDGTGFLFSRNATYSISYKNASGSYVVLPGDQIDRFSDSRMTFRVPANAQNGSFKIAVGGIEVATDSIFQVISTISVTPTAYTLSSGFVQLTATATDSDGATILNPDAGLRWVKLSQDCSNCGTVDSLASLDPNTPGKVVYGNAGNDFQGNPKVGTVKIGVGIAPMLATASITVN